MTVQSKYDCPVFFAEAMTPEPLWVPFYCHALHVSRWECMGIPFQTIMEN